ncbi:MAG: 50S ribosomal protein L35 [Alphaproteobacteria bacterium]|nr:50S ribosomal protein L35 [Alphaproteobacteria bacterium]
MPKLKSKSGAKKRFRLSAKGKVVMYHSGMRHNLRKRSQKTKRKARGNSIMADADARIVRKFIPYA